MQNLYTIITRKESVDERLTAAETFSLLYHDQFDYPLSFPDLIKWIPLCKECSEQVITHKNGFYFLDGREGIAYKRVLRERISKKKLEIASRAARILSFLPLIKMVAVTGSLAMANSTDESDIDLMIITRKSALWTTRAISYLVSSLLGIKTRKPGDKNQKDKLCLNIWLDESDLIWGDRNFYTAHEIAQIVPLVNKDETYEKFLFKNRWILKFWPNSVRIAVQDNKITKKRSRGIYGVLPLIEKVAYKLQYRHMRAKITRELVSPTRALFHPQDWGKVVLDRLTQV